MVTAREHILVSGACMSRSKSVRRHRHLPGHASHERYMQFLTMLKGEKQIFTSLPQTRPARVTRELSTSHFTVIQLVPV